MENLQIDRYEFITELGRGAMGVVYKARDTVLDRIVAIKAVDMSRERDGMSNYEARFYQEARSAGGLNHPNIVTIYDIGKSGTIAYMAMEFIEGQELRALLAPGQPIPPRQAISIAAQVAEGLAFAHERGIIHRDIKPANIMIAPDLPAKITDFGIARMRTSTELTETGAMLGSPKYMSPEQALGKRADPRSDVFSLGVILYEMLTGVPPFSGETIAAVMYQIVNFAPPAPSTLNPAIPVAADAIIAKMIAKPLEARYSGAAEAARALRDLERALELSDVSQAALSRTLAGQTRIGATWVGASEATLVLRQSLDRTRLSDNAELVPADTGRTLSDSSETRQLAALAGMDLEATRGNEAEPVAPIGMSDESGWRRRDWLLVAGAAALGAVTGAVLIGRKKR